MIAVVDFYFPFIELSLVVCLSLCAVLTVLTYFP
jgi:hypothetical protein